MNIWAILFPILGLVLGFITGFAHGQKRNHLNRYLKDFDEKVGRLKMQIPDESIEIRKKD